MAEEIKKNTVGTVGMRFSIIGLIACITIIGIFFGFPLLCLGFILGIIGLFRKPRAKARVAVIIPLIVFIAVACIASYFWRSIKTPTNEFRDWVNPQLEQLEDDENFDEERFENALRYELNNISNNKSEEERKDLFETSTGSNSIEKGAYLFFSIMKQGFESAFEKYNDESREFDEEDINNEIIDVEISTDDEENIDEEEIDGEEVNEEEINEENDNQEVAEPKVENTKKEKSGTFNQSEQKDIEQILNILE